MTLIASISGIRGTIGGKPGDNLTPVDAVKFATAYALWVKKRKGKKIVIGRDARVSGEQIAALVSASCNAAGLDVIDIGLSTTPTVEMAVPMERAGGGIIVTASHNPIQWNALKLLNEKGEFISAQDGEEILDIAKRGDFEYAPIHKIGKTTQAKDYLKKHIDKVCAHKWVDKAAIRKAKFRIAVDAVNSSGGVAVPMLLKKLGVKTIKEINCEPTGVFAHTPEPLPENLKEICRAVKKGAYHLGIVVDPDVDRLALIMEDGKPFGEEYTLVAVADYVLSHKKGNAVSNLSSTRALRDVVEARGGRYAAAAVGEVNVVAAMKKHKAVIGGEGNGGVIFPQLHYGRDALIGIAFFLTHLAKQKKKMTQLRAEYPAYFIAKNKIDLPPSADIENILSQLREQYAGADIDLTDGVKINLHETREWIHLRRSNTEPIVRIYAESLSLQKAENLAKDAAHKIKKLLSQ